MRYLLLIIIFNSFLAFGDQGDDILSSGSVAPLTIVGGHTIKSKRNESYAEDEEDSDDREEDSDDRSAASAQDESFKHHTH